MKAKYWYFQCTREKRDTSRFKRDSSRFSRDGGNLLLSGTVCLNSRLVHRIAQATVRTPCCLDNAINELFLKVNSLKIVLKYSRNLDTQQKYPF